MKPLDLATAKLLLDFSGGSDSLKALASLQLKGAVALHNMLADPEIGVGYLADEVGMGKTYVALGVVALMRYFNPGLRVLYICPSRNVQEKWYGREHPNFIRKNVLTSHFKIRTPEGEPGTPAISCASIEDLINAATTGYYGDIFVRMSSFSMAMGEDDTGLKEKLDWLKERVPTSVLEGVRARKGDVKEAYARAVNYLLPDFDLVVIDEAHNFKHDFNSSARNLALSRILGFNPDTTASYQCRANLALLLSATPFDLNPLHLYNQLALVGRGHLLPEPDDWGDRGELRSALSRFMVRRLNELEIAGTPHSRNMYRREWRKGERAEIDFNSDEHKLITALVQKHVGDMLNREGGNPSFQLGLLASFESYAQTSRSGPVEFDGEKPVAGIQDARDRHLIGVIRDSYVVENNFGSSLPHPKMDQVSREVAFDAFERGRKQLVFVRRVRSVAEFKQKLDDRHNHWLLSHIRSVLANSGKATVFMEEVIARYAEVSKRLDDDITGGEVHAASDDGAERVPPKNDTLFNWFFRGESPVELAGVLASDYSEWTTPESLKKSLIARNNSNGLLFEFNWAELIARECFGETAASLLGKDDRLLRKIADKIRPVAEGDRLSLFLAAQEAFLRVMASRSSTMTGLSEVAEYLGGLVQSGSVHPKNTEVVEQLTFETFFCHLHRTGFVQTCFGSSVELAKYIRERGKNLYEAIHRVEIHRQLVAQAFRTGHPWVDLYLSRLLIGSAELSGVRRSLWMRQLCDMLAGQRDSHAFSSVVELSLLNDNLDLVIKSNLPGAYSKTPKELRVWLNQILPSSAPVIGANGETSANRSVQARKFRMPGYPLVLVSTDVFQEGEDLHTFCDSVVHYGLSSSPISIEQKTGRVDRVGASAHRRLLALDKGREIAPDDFIQVRFPFVKQSIEAIQVRTLSHNLNNYLGTLHEIGGSGPSIMEFVDASRELFNRNEIPDQLLHFLKSPYVPAVPQNSGLGLEAMIELESEKVNDALEHVKQLVVEVMGALWNHNGKLVCATPEFKGLELQVSLTSARSSGEMLLCARDTIASDLRLPSEWSLNEIHEYQKAWYSNGTARIFAVRETDGIALYKNAEMLVGDSEVTCSGDLTGFFRRFSGEHEGRKSTRLSLEELPFLEDARVNQYLLNRYHWKGVFTTKNSRAGLQLFFSFGGDRARKHGISLKQSNGDCVFEAQVADNHQVGTMSAERLLALTWYRNRNIDLVEFLIRPDGCLVGRAFQPFNTMGFEECVFTAYVLAVEADRLEYLLKVPDEY